MTRVSKSLADEIKEEEAASAAAANATAAARPEPPPDILVSSNCRRKIWPELDNNEELGDRDDDGGGGTFNDGFTEDWDMILETEPSATIPEAVDIIIRQQPSNDESSSFYCNARRMVVHQIHGVEMTKPSCGNCCILQ